MWRLKPKDLGISLVLMKLLMTVVLLVSMFSLLIPVCNYNISMFGCEFPRAYDFCSLMRRQVITTTC